MKLFLIFTFFISINSLKYELTNIKHIHYKKAISNPNIPIIIASGSPGTGKTYIACKEAISLYNSLSIDKIIITRPIITVDENLGFLPGSFEDKMNPFLMHIYDYFMEHYTKENLNYMIKSSKIEIVPLAYMRGRTFKNAIIIADEMQNTTPNQMKMLLTRLGENCKIIINGDIEQSDIIIHNGLNDIINKLLLKYNNSEELMLINGFYYINFDSSCIYRHKMIETILQLYK